jgi:D-3-phosphoglycerate dehydrogenase
MAKRGKAVFIDCPPFLHDLYSQDLARIVPDLSINVGSPTREQAIALLEGCEFAMIDHTTMDEAFLEACPSLRVIVFLGLGAASFIDLEAAKKLGVRVRNYGGYGDRSVAEHAIALMFAACRKIAAMDRAVRAGSFEPMDGIELFGKTLGVVGAGGVGREMARLGAALGMEVIAWNRSSLPDDLPATFAELDDLLGRADVVSLHVALNDDTKGLIDARRLALLKKTAILINTARGAVLDEAALIEILEAGRIAHAALDVFEKEPIPAAHPLARLANTTLTPHAGFMTREASERLLKTALDILAAESAEP